MEAMGKHIRHARLPWRESSGFSCTSDPAKFALRPNGKRTICRRDRLPNLWSMLLFFIRMAKVHDGSRG
ncbi:hypothetical protein Rhsp01_63380 [Rhizobium sp. NBRC 114257]|nr:hypothetical protein Rhsp01_63380 [Rhizobium sp. NBRC 114257]